MSNATQQKQTVAAVFPDTKDGNKAFNVLEAAATELKSITVDRIPFERLDFGETEILDRFYGANAAVVDVTERSYQAAMFYQLGLRESFGMKHNVVTCVDQTAITGMRESVTSSPLSNSAAIGVSYLKAKRQHPVALHAVTRVVTLAMPSLCFKLTFDGVVWALNSPSRAKVLRIAINCAAKKYRNCDQSCKHRRPVFTFL